MHRRVESIEILDDRSIHRRVSLDIAIEPDQVFPMNQGLDPTTLGFTPLTLLRKEVLRNFDLRDRHGQPLPMLTKEQIDKIAVDCLIFIAEGILGAALPGSLEHNLRFVVAAHPEIARREFEYWRWAATDPRNPDHGTWKALMTEEAFVDFANSLVDNFMLLAATGEFPSERQVLKLGYEELFTDEDRSGSWSAFSVLFGWSRKCISVDVPAVSLSTSYHLEVAAPADLEIDAAQLRFEHVDPSEGGSIPERVTVGGGLQHAHLYAGNVGSGFHAKAVIFLRRQRDAYLTSAFLTALLVCILLAFGLSRLGNLLGSEHAGQGQTAGALLLITPTLLAAYIARPGEHRLASKILKGVRALVVGTAFCSIVAVGVLVGGYSTRTSQAVWGLDLIVASCIALGLLASLLLPRPTRA
jgi:hypothetical protein